MRIVPELKQPDPNQLKLSIEGADPKQELFGMFNLKFATAFRRAVIEYRIRNVLSQEPIDVDSIKTAINSLHRRTITKSLIPISGAFTILFVYLIQHLVDRVDQEQLIIIVNTFLAIIMLPTTFLANNRHISRSTDNLINSNLKDNITDKNRFQFIELFEMISREMSQRIKTEIDKLEYELTNPNLSPEQRTDLNTKIADQVRQLQVLDSKLANARINLLAKPHFCISDINLTSTRQWEPEDLITHIGVQEDVLETSPETVIAEVTQAVQTIS